MLRNILRSAILQLSGLLLTASVLPDAVQARGGFYARSYGYGLHRPAYRPFAAVGLGVGLGYGYYRYPLDDSYDYPYGYGDACGPLMVRAGERSGCAIKKVLARISSERCRHILSVTRRDDAWVFNRPVPKPILPTTAMTIPTSPQQWRTDRSA